jgi:cobalt-zinc-cadmium efflux system outer membrane protein
MGGVRLNADGSRLFAGSASLSWPVDLGGQRGARVDAAKAEQRGATAAAEDAQRRVVLAALLQHALALRDERLVALAAERRALAERLAAAAEKRRKAGSAPEVEVALAALQVRRDAALEAAAKGARDADKIALVALLGLAQIDPKVTGALVPPGDPPPLSALLREVDQRTDVRSAAAALSAARARSSREQASRFPTISVLAQYERDERANIGLLGLAVPIPVLNANRAGVATSAAEVDVARAREEATRAAAEGNIRQLHARYAATKKALSDLEPAAGLAGQAVTIATRGYELGENDLASVLLVRREANDALAALLEAELAHANAKIELLVTAGRIPQ